MKSHPHLRLVCLGVAAALSGCADLSWEKQGTDQSTASRDLDECRQEVESNAYRQGVPSTVTTPNVIIGPGGSAAVTFQTPAATPYPDPAMMEDFTRACMRKKGYELIRRR